MRKSSPASSGPQVTLGERLVSAGLAPEIAAELDAMPHRLLAVTPRRPFREPGAAREEVLFVRSGILAKYKTDGTGRRRIIALRFAGEGMLPRRCCDYGIQAVVRSEVMVGKSSDFERILDAHPQLARFFWRLSQRHSEIGYEWLVNCSRRDTVARVAHLLCETAERSGVTPGKDRMRNPFTQQQIADITGQTSVNVNRVFADLERQGIIRRDGREILFRDWQELQRIGSFHPDYLR